MAVHNATSHPAPVLDAEQRRSSRRIALRIGLIYLFVASVWIAVSDYSLDYLVDYFTDSTIPPGIRETVVRHRVLVGSTYKGWGFVLVTAAMLFLLIRSYIHSVQRAELMTQEEIARTAAEYQVLFDNNPLPMWVYDPDDLRIGAVNDAAVAKYGYSRAEFLKLRISDIRPPKDVPKLREHIDEIRDRFSTTGIWTHLKKDGTRIDVEISGHPITFNGQRRRLVVAMDVTQRLQAQRSLEQYRLELEHRVIQRTDDLLQANVKLQMEIHERQLVEEQLRHAKQIADDANSAKSLFVAKTTHELRTPLTSILGFADLLQDDQLSPQRRNTYLQVLQQSAAQLLTLIDDLLDVSRIEAGKLNLVFGEIAPRELIASVVDQLRPRATEKGLALNVVVEERIPATLYTDSARVRQILMNLLSNALKFTTTGSVTITACNTTVPAPHMAIPVFQIAVTDTGIGIPADQLSHIFQPFYQVEQSNSRRYDGSGLGLPICRQLAEKLGGWISVTSVVGQGSTFTLALPVQTTPPADGDRPQLAARILLAEDNTNVRNLVQEYLRRAGADVTAVANGPQALEAMRRAATGNQPMQLVILDINMPDIDGPQCARLLRQEGYAGPLLALTAHAAHQDENPWKEAGFDAVLAKPIDTQTFIPTLVRFLTK